MCEINLRKRQGTIIHVNMGKVIKQKFKFFKLTKEFGSFILILNKIINQIGLPTKFFLQQCKSSVAATKNKY